LRSFYSDDYFAYESSADSAGESTDGTSLWKWSTENGSESSGKIYAKT